MSNCGTFFWRFPSDGTFNFGLWVVIRHQLYTNYIRLYTIIYDYIRLYKASTELRLSGLSSRWNYFSEADKIAPRNRIPLFWAVEIAFLLNWLIPKLWSIDSANFILIPSLKFSEFASTVHSWISAFSQNLSWSLKWRSLRSIIFQRQT